MFREIYFLLLCLAVALPAVAQQPGRMLRTVEKAAQARPGITKNIARIFPGVNTVNVPLYVSPRTVGKNSFSPFISPCTLETALTRQFASLAPNLATHWQSFPGGKEIKAVIFDLDGTLLDSLGAWEHASSNFLRSRGIEPPEGIEEEMAQLSLLQGAGVLKERYQLPDTEEEILRQTLAPIARQYYQRILPMPGVPDLLKRLQSQGVKMAVATASHREFAQVALERLGLRNYFDFIITCDEVGVGKKSPAIYQEAARRLGTTPAQTLVAEDALHALQTAKAAGFKTAAIVEKHSMPDETAKQALADYYVISYKGNYTLAK